MAERNLVAREDIDDVKWDEEEIRDDEWRPREIPMFQPQGAAVREVAVALSRASRNARRRARRYNPNRHLEHEDYVSARQSTPPPEDEAGPPCRRVRPDEPRRQDNRHVPGGARVRLEGVIFGGLRPVPTDPSIDPPPYHCFNCWQPDHFSGQCPRPRVRIYCRNCGRHGEDPNCCPRCGEAHAEFLRRNFGGERGYEQELERRSREALYFEQQRAEEMRRRQFIAEQEWRARMEAGARAQQASLQNSVAGVPPRQAQLRGDARAVPAPTLYAAAELVGGLQAMPVEGQEIVIRAMHESLNRR